jgi:hypothetical protein
MSTLERIIQEVRMLSPLEQEQLRQMLDKEAGGIEKLRRIQAKYAHLPNSSYDFAARKTEEMEKEDRKA